MGVVDTDLPHRKTGQCDAQHEASRNSDEATELYLLLPPPSSQFFCVKEPSLCQSQKPKMSSNEPAKRAKTQHHKQRIQQPNQNQNKRASYLRPYADQQKKTPNDDHNDRVSKARPTDFFYGGKGFNVETVDSRKVRAFHWTMSQYNKWEKNEEKKSLEISDGEDEEVKDSDDDSSENEMRANQHFFGGIAEQKATSRFRSTKKEEMAKLAKALTECWFSFAPEICCGVPFRTGTEDPNVNNQYICPFNFETGTKWVDLHGLREGFELPQDSCKRSKAGVGYNTLEELIRHLADTSLHEDQGHHFVAHRMFYYLFCQGYPRFDCKVVSDSQGSPWDHEFSPYREWTDKLQKNKELRLDVLPADENYELYLPTGWTKVKDEERYTNDKLDITVGHKKMAAIAAGVENEPVANTASLTVKNEEENQKLGATALLEGQGDASIGKSEEGSKHNHPIFKKEEQPKKDTEEGIKKEEYRK